MHTHPTIAAMRAACEAARQHGPLALVPTMGALHAGHLSLIQQARASSETVAVSIFVNPLQFAATEDLARYPRQLERDLELLATAGVDHVFTPTSDEMYPTPTTPIIDPGPIATRLCGAHRPGHFAGVATVVARLFDIIQPQRAFFGQKDAAQVAVLRHLIRQLSLPIELVACPTIRDPDGLALSSRNAYLTPAERAAALAIPRALESMQWMLTTGLRDAALILHHGREILTAEPTLTLEYLEAVNPETLLPTTEITPNTLVAIAAHAGTTRLIDNFLAP